MIKRVTIGLLSCLCLLGGPAWSQLEPSARLEMQVTQSKDESFDVAPLGKKGVLVTVRRNNYYSTEPVTFSFQKYTTDLKPIWTTDYKTEFFYEPVRSYQNENYLYWLFKKSDDKKISILRLNLEDGHTEFFKGDLISQLDMTQFKVLDNMAYIGGYYRSRPVVMTFSFFDLTMKALPGLYVNHIQLNNIEVDEYRRLIHVMTDAEHQRNCEFVIHTYSYEGKLLHTSTIDGMTHSLISGKMLPLNEDESLLVGNYSNDCTPYSQGVYISRLRHNGDRLTNEPGESRYIDFSELQNFFNYMKPKQQRKMLERIGRRKNMGKDTKFRYRLLVHDLIPTDEGLMLVAEVYYPQYRGTSPYTYPGGVRSFDRYLEGYRYTHAFICGFDHNGKLLWDNCLAIPDLTSYELHPMVQVSRQGNTTILAYPQEGEINTELIEGNKILRERENFSLKKLSEHEKVLYSEEDHLEAWYDQHFLACGFQKISTERSSAPPREVFYINKLTYSVKDLGDKPASHSEAASESQPDFILKTSGSKQ